MSLRLYGSLIVLPCFNTTLTNRLCCNELAPVLFLTGFIGWPCLSRGVVVADFVTAFFELLVLCCAAVKQFLNFIHMSTRPFPALFSMANRMEWRCLRQSATEKKKGFG